MREVLILPNLLPLASHVNKLIHVPYSSLFVSYYKKLRCDGRWDWILMTNEIPQMACSSACGPYSSPFRGELYFAVEGACRAVAEYGGFAGKGFCSSWQFEELACVVAMESAGSKNEGAV